MEILRTEEKKITTEKGETLTVYYELTESVELGETQYGITACVVETGEKECVNDISSSKTEVAQLLDKLLKNDVTPCTLKDVIYDYITEKAMLD
jgi:hypothetical protein